MSRRVRTWAATAAFAALVAGGALAFGQVSGTFAIFTAETENPNAVFQGGWIPAPTTSSISIGGTGNLQAVMTWALGSWTGTGSNPQTGDKILFADGGSNSSASCPGGTYGTTSDTITNTTTLTDSLTGSPNTDWWCYQVVATSATVWTSQPATFSAVRPLVPTGIATANGGSSGTMDSGDTITITYDNNNNEPVSYSGGNVFVCAYAGSGGTGWIVIGDSSVAGGSTNNGACNGSGSGDTATIGKISGVSVISTRLFYGSTVTPSGSTVRVTLGNAGGSGANSRTNVTGTGTFTPAGATVTATTGGWTQCTTGSTCTPSSSMSF